MAGLRLQNGARHLPFNRRALREEYEPSGEEFAEDEAYALFVADTGAANPQMALDEASQLAVSQWRAMSIRQRAPFYAMVALGMTAGTPVSDDVVSEVAHDQSSEDAGCVTGGSSSGSVLHVDERCRQWQARNMALEARIWTMLHVSGSNFGHGANSGGPGPVNLSVHRSAFAPKSINCWRFWPNSGDVDQCLTSNSEP